MRTMTKDYDYLLKVLLVGDSDVGKHEILSNLEDPSTESPFCSGNGKSSGASDMESTIYIYTIYTHIDCTSHILQTVAYKTTTILLEGKRVKLQIWDTSGQGRFCTIIRSYSRGAQGIILVYDITNKWSFDGIDRWLKEVEEVSSRSTKDTQTGYKRNFGSKRFTRLLDALGSKVSFAYCDLNQFLLIVSL